MINDDIEIHNYEHKVHKMTEMFSTTLLPKISERVNSKHLK